MDHDMTTTAYALDGYRTVRTLGVVRGMQHCREAVQAFLADGHEIVFAVTDPSRHSVDPW